MMSMITIMTIMKMTKNMNPMYLAFMILMISIMMTMIIFKSILSSWLSFVIILTFSSGMMTLFMYTASLSSNEKTKFKKSTIMITMLLLIMIMEPINQSKTIKQSMKMFSNQNNLMFMGIILITTMLAISSHGHHPNQTLSTSF